MIQENELKLNNLIIPLIGSLEHIGKITSISSNFINYDLIDDNFEEYLSISHESTLSNIKPIPLTEEWLLKFGFEKGNDFIGDCFYIEREKEDFVLHPKKDYFYFYFLYDSVEVKHVHQLQNLYFVLTNEELTLKE